MGDDDHQPVSSTCFTRKTSPKKLRCYRWSRQLKDCLSNPKFMSLFPSLVVLEGGLFRAKQNVQLSMILFRMKDYTLVAHRALGKVRHLDLLLYVEWIYLDICCNNYDCKSSISKKSQIFSKISRRRKESSVEFSYICWMTKLLKRHALTRRIKVGKSFLLLNTRVAEEERWH